MKHQVTQWTAREAMNGRSTIGAVADERQRPSEEWPGGLMKLTFLVGLFGW